MIKLLKSLAVHTLMTLISGVILISIGAVSVVMWDTYKNGTVIEPARKFREVENIYDNRTLSNDLQIIDLVRLEDLEKFTVKGKIKNVSQKTYFTFHVNLEYLVEEIKMGDCYRHAGENIDLKPGESMGFLIECSDFKPKKLPSQFSFKAYVASASRYAK